MLLPLAVTAAGGPVVFVGGRSARWTKSITGSTALRITGWISYGVALAAQLTAMFLPGLPIIAGLIGAGSLTCFSIDALMSASEAADVAEMASTGEGVRFGPTVSLVPGINGSGGGGAVIGMAGRF
jgi:hypothetical protein